MHERRRCPGSIIVTTNKNSLSFDSGHCRVEPTKIDSGNGVIQPGFRVSFLEKNKHHPGGNRNFAKNAELKERRKKAKERTKDKHKRR